jgi:hypothetical protein
MLGVKVKQRDANWKLNTVTSLILDRISILDTRAHSSALGLATITLDSGRVKIVPKLRDDKRRLKFDVNATLIEVDTRALLKPMSQFTLVPDDLPVTTRPARAAEEVEAMIDSARFLHARSPMSRRMSTRRCITEAVDLHYGHDDCDLGFRIACDSEEIRKWIGISAGYFNILVCNLPLSSSYQLEHCAGAHS